MRNVCINNARSISYEDSSSSSEFFVEALEAHIDTVGKLPDEVFISSSCEMSYLPFTEIQRSLELLFERLGNTQIKIVSQGCLGIFATSIEFYNRTELNDVLVLFIEAPKECSQNGLNAVGVGVLDGQDGLEISPSLASFTLLNKSTVEDEDIMIDYSYMLSVSLDLAKQAFTLLEMTKKISSLISESGGRVISFDVSAPWSQAISKSVKSAVHRKSPEAEWLPSIEQDHKHYMTVKQIKELQEYQSSLDNAPLIFTGLGVGGRFGILRMLKGRSYSQSNYPSSNEVNINFLEHYQINYDVLIGDTTNLLSNMKQHTYCYKKEFRGQDNTYFTWLLDMEFYRNEIQKSEEVV